MSYTPSQQEIIDTAKRRLKAKAQPLHGRVAKSLIESLGVESNYANLPGGDRDSTGALQQRNNGAWGSPNEPVATDIDQYLAAAIRANQGFKGSAGQLAQSVQRSAYPGRYDQRGAEAAAILGSSSAPGASNVSSIASSPASVPGVSQATPTQPSVFDVIRQYDDATKQRNDSLPGLGQPFQPFDATASATKIQDTVQQMLAQRELAKAPVASPSTGAAVNSALNTPANPGKGKVIIAKGANRAGVDLQPGILNFVNGIAASAGEPITIGTGTNHNRMTTSGNVSDHWGGYGADLEVGGDARQSQQVAQKGDLIAAHAIANASGMDFNKALQMARKGGLWNFDTKLGRIQIIWKTLVGGNHYNHVHTGLNPA